MIQRLNYYSRYNRIKNQQDIKSLYQFIIDFDLIGSLDDSYAFRIKKQKFQEENISQDKLSPIKEFHRQPNIFRIESGSEHKRNASYDQFRIHERQYDACKPKKDIPEDKYSLHQEEKKQDLNPDSVQQQQQKTQSVRNPTNLQEMNFLETESIPQQGQDQSDQFSECQPAHFPLVSSQKQINRSSQFQENDEDNFSSIQLNNMFDLRKNSMDIRELLEKQIQHSKSERLQRIHCSDIQVNSEHSRHFNCDQEIQRESIEEQKEQQNERKQFQSENKNIISIPEQAKQYDENILDDSELDNMNDNDQMSEEQQIHQSIQCETPREQRNNDFEAQQYLKEENLEYNFRLKKNQLQNMHFGYEDKADMRIGYQNYPSENAEAQSNNSDNYTPEEIQQSLNEMKKQLNKEEIQARPPFKNDNLTSKINTERKPFKKFMMNKKLNPRMATSTIVNEIGQIKPKKVNFKKMLRKQKSENKIKFDDLVTSRKSQKPSQANKEKKKLLQAFFDQN